jgi:serine phosphatase RsbU (regulator of sigma subunit)
MVAGVHADLTYNEESVLMQPGDCLVFITDGLTEAREGSDGELMQWEGTARLAQKYCQEYSALMLSGEPEAARAMAAAIYEDTCRFASSDGENTTDSGLSDDMALLVVYVTNK